MSTVQRALAYSFIERYALIAISLASNIILARLLTPEQIGIYSVSLAVIGVAQVLRDFGIGNFLIQLTDVKPEHIRTAFGISLVIGVVLFGVVYVAAPLAGDYYGEPAMVLTIRISALNFLVLPFCSISVALLRRAMEFRRLVFVTLAATLAGFVVTIALAYAGYGPNSMAIGALAGNVATGIGSRLARRDGTTFLPSLSEWRALISFGAQSSLTSIVITVCADVNDLAIGKILGFTPVAIISRAQGLMFLFSRDLMAAIRNVAYPAYAQAHRNGDHLESHYVDSVTAVTVLAWPFYGFCSLYAFETLRLLFGRQWDAAVPLVSWFCAAGAVAATTNLITTLMLAIGKIGLVTRTELLLQPFRAGVIILAAVLFESLIACAVAYLIATVASVPVLYWFKQKCIATNIVSLRHGLSKSLQVTCATLAVPFAVVVHAGVTRAEPIALPLFVGVAIWTAVAWLIALSALKHPLAANEHFQRIEARVLRVLGRS
ncbi:MAG: lipopolysaccharide biosynthesis protein [Burkholderiales bacterium]